MNRIEIDHYNDLRGDRVLHSRGRDVVYRELDEGAQAVLYVEEWLVDEKDLDWLEEISQLAAGRLLHETENAYLFTTSDDRDPNADEPGTEWVPKSQSRVYIGPADDEADEDESSSTGQVGLDRFGPIRDYDTE